MVQEIILNKSASENISKWGFTYAEIEELGIAALHNFNMTYGIDIMTFNLNQIRNLYYDIINDHNKYKRYFEWLAPRFKKFIELNIPMRIYVGGVKQFINRGDKQLEKSLENVYTIINKYIITKKISPKEITLIFYYLNLIFK